MNKVYEPLFTPFKIGDVEIPNRIVQCSMGGTSLFGWLEPSHFDLEASDFLLKRAKDGVGLVLPGMQVIRDTMGRKWLDQNKQMYRVLKPYMDEYHKTGGKLFIQLAGGFGRSMAVTGWMTALAKNDLLNKIASPFVDVQYSCASASETPNRWADFNSRPFTIEEIQEMVYHFGLTAKKLREAGLDGVEIHAVHEGYNLDQFAIANMNFRNDQYGGSLENRLRFATEIVQSIHEHAGDDFPVSLRYSVRSMTKGWRQGAMPGEDFVEFGRDMEESKKAVKILADAGYAFFNCDNGTYDAWYWAHPPQYMPDNCNLDDVIEVRPFAGGAPFACAGRMDPVKAAEEIAAGRLDAMAIARQNLVDENWVTKIKAGKEDDIRPCIRCHNGCFNFAKFEGTENIQSLGDSLHLGRCALNPPTMQHNRYKIVPAKKSKKVAIIGGGVGGMECALVCKKRGHQPVLFEKTNELGGLFLTASAFSFKEHDRDLLVWYKKQLKDYNIDVRMNEEIKDIDALKKQFDEVIVCTGSVPRKMPSITGFDKTLTFTEIFREGKDPGDKPLFLGGGQSSCEAAYDFIKMGKKPIIVEYGGDLVAAQATCLANTSFLRDAMKFHNVPVYLHSTVTEIGDGYAMVKTPDGVEKIECSCVVNGVGFIPTPLGERAEHVHRVGDCVAIGNLRTVIWRAWDICMRI